MRSSHSGICAIVLRALISCAAFIVLAMPIGPSTARAAGRVIAGPVVAADSVHNPTRLVIISVPPGAAVYADSVLLGTTPLDTVLPPVDDLRPRTLRLKIVGGEPGAWFVPVLFDSILLSPGSGSPEGVVRHYTLPFTARVASEPAGADVLLGDSLIGTTPLFAALNASVALLTVRKDGYQSAAVVLEPSTRNYRVQLLSVDPAGAVKPVYLTDGSGKSMLPVFLAAGAAVVSGAAAAYFKEQADREYSVYRFTGDASTLDAVRKNDVLSGIALVVAEISIGYLVIELLSR